MTPRGRHLIRAKIGSGCPENTIFVARRPTGALWTPELAAQFPGRDWILTRILWLSGCEPGCNRLGPVDTMRRYIYVHGTPDTVTLGKPGSRGCLRMSNQDIVELFARVPAYTGVNIGDFRVTAAARRGDALEVEALDNCGSTIARCRASGDGIVTEMEVSQAWRGKGVARQLLRSLIAYATAAGMARLGVDLPGPCATTWSELGFLGVRASAGPAMVLNLAEIAV